jgi:phage gp16-like protein
LAALTASAALAATTSASAAPAAQTAWAAQANKVCVVWLAKAKKELGSPVTAAQLYGFAVRAKKLESAEYAVLAKLHGRDDSGAAALVAMKVDIAELGSAITAWNHGNAALFVQILKKYLNDGRAKSAFAIAGANKCG